jgi:hypothetical protein
MAHQLTIGASTFSGVAELGGDELAVTMLCYPADPYVSSANAIRNTIAHELGHNLGLLHGGDEICNNKPNYNSLMNYQFQFGGVDADCNGISDGGMGYSNGSERTLDENNLNETLGMCFSPVVRMDWNFDRKYTTSVVANINNYSGELAECGGSYFTLLHDFNDWANLKPASVSPYFYRAAGTNLKASQTVSVPCPGPPPLHK